VSQNPITGVEESVAAESGVGPARKGGTVQFEYRFDREGGAVGTVFLLGPTLPEGAIIKDAYIDVLTVPTSGGAATVALGFETTTDVNAADAISGAPWSATGRVDADALELGTESGYVKLTAARGLRMTIGTAALTAGRFAVHVLYDVTD
jgi:hypothetical protein